MIVGLSGRAGAGKSTAAKHLASLGFAHHSFAAPLKEAAKLIFSLTDAQVYGDQKAIIDPFWRMTPRAILQLLGTECLRNGFSDDVWIRSLMRRIDGVADVVIDDVRFQNEAAAIRSAGGLIIRVERYDAKAVGGVVGHQSENDLTSYSFDAVIENHGGLFPFQCALERVLARASSAVA